MKRVYIEYNKYKFKEIIKIITTFDDVNSLSLKIHLNDKVKINKIYQFIKRKKIKKISFVISNNNYSNEVIKLLNSKKKNITIQFILKNELSKKDKIFFDKLTKINKNFEVYDHSDFSNEEYFNKIKNISYFKTKEEKYKNKMLYLYSDNGQSYCKNISCLGKIISIDKNGDIFFCPKHSDQTYLTNIKNYISFNDLFENDNFIKVLETMIDKRKKCNEMCQYFSKCKSGCPLEVTCENYKKYYILAEKTINEIIKNNINLNDVPLSVKENILWILCNRRTEYYEK